MRCVRANRRVGAWAALFALTVQFVLSFGHVHLDKLTTSSPGAVTAWQQTANRDGAPPANRGADDFCAICATIGLLASSVLPEPAQLRPPSAVASVLTSHLGAVAPLFDYHVLFQARAPPVIG